MNIQMEKYKETYIGNANFKRDLEELCDKWHVSDLQSGYLTWVTLDKINDYKLKQVQLNLLTGECKY